MNLALQKTITLLLLIGLGIILRKRIKNAQALSGIKEVILSVALPSTIFIALMKISMDVSMIVIPLAMLFFNLLLFFSLPLIFPLVGLDRKSASAKTLMLLIPSLAPGLSCFPFIAEYLGERSLALAALADVGNKFFVLIFLYVVALNMFLANGAKKKINFKLRARTLSNSLINEPVNIVILIALILLGFGVSYATLPAFVTDLMDKTSALMIPLVLIFIGLAVQWKEARKKLVVSVLFFRAGFTMLIAALLITVFQPSNPNYILLMVVLPLSSVSF